MTVFCHIAHRFPSVVATMLEQEKNLVQGRFRETTFTDLLAASLIMLDRPELQIDYPREPSTGGDLDLVYWDRRTGERLTVRIQAKRLSPATEGGRPIRWEIRRYNHLDHVVPGTGQYQYWTLTSPRPSVVPLYAFYNHQAVVEDPQVRKLKPVVDGANLAFATDIGIELAPHLRVGSTAHAPSYAKRLKRLQPYFFPLTRLLCAPHRGVPRPRDIERNLHRTFESLIVPAGVRDRQHLQFALQASPQAPASYVEGGPSFRISEGVERPTILFISGDDRGD